jgi:small conductance mechanosensitive channel
MNWEQVFSQDTLFNMVIPIVSGLVIILVLLFLHRFVYAKLRKTSESVKPGIGAMLAQETRIAFRLWFFWLGIFVAFSLFGIPDSWQPVADKVVPALFVALGIYTAISLLMGFFKWYRQDICCRTAGTLDDVIMNALIFGTPIVGGALGIIAILNILGYSHPAVNDWIRLHLVKLIILAVVVIILLLLTLLFTPRVVERAVRGSRSEQSEEDIRKRSETLTSVIVTTIQVVLIFMFVLMGLTEIGINVTAVLTGAGVVSLAVAFGAQTLVKDVISGLFIIMENQYRKGDVITIAGVTGVVEELNLRRTILRDVEGIYHVIPNGQIGVSSNMTRQLSRVNLTISVSYETDLDKAMKVINRVGQEMANDPSGCL